MPADLGEGGGAAAAEEEDEEEDAQLWESPAGAKAPADAAALTAAAVTRVEPCGMGDRVAVDLTCVMAPGEGMLVGSFAGGLFFVHAENQETGYVAPRAFRVNAGAVCSYLAMPGGRTAYLAEVACGGEALVAGAGGGRARVATVGRAKVEARPMVMVEARSHEDGRLYCVVLQNAETVRLARAPGGEPVGVSELLPGDEVLIALQGGGARHTGILVEEERFEER